MKAEITFTNGDKTTVILQDKLHELRLGQIGFLAVKDIADEDLLINTYNIFTIKPLQ